VSTSWDTLTELAATVGTEKIRDLLTEDPSRATRMVVEGAGVTLDYSRQRVDQNVMDALVSLAEERGVLTRRDAMFAGEHINVTEDRAVLHVALRMPKDETLVVDGVDVVAEVHGVLDRMKAFSERVRNGEWVGHTGKRIKNVVNIGIGGSDLGPVMAYLALRDYSDREHDVPVRLQRRRHGHRRGDQGPGSGRDAVHRLEQDVHDVGDDDERGRGPRLGARRVG
jgi:glucose-6-phosphate isomerase